MNQTVFSPARAQVESFLYIVRAVFYVAVFNGTRVSIFNSFINMKTGRTSLIH
ncbi:RAxF-45 family protein [Alteribacter lacisalsi]|uniref:RAxF-45 family protein n=1 Tax=Alteribacter lacisalsi TaxID=2045244 RepID=UPI001374CAEC|nr:RAxF-45 family protein [Alteribacter lacisalsi]